MHAAESVVLMSQVRALEQQAQQLQSLLGEKTQE